MPTECFWTEPTGLEAIFLRRYSRGPHDVCPDHGYHNAVSEEIDQLPTQWDTVPREGDDEDGRKVNVTSTRLQREGRYNDHPAWPTKCDCGYEFVEGEDPWQVFTDTYYRAANARGEWRQRDLPPGAMLNAWWLPDSYRGDDDIALMVVLPDGHQWLVDSRANNCTRPDDQHKCWVRHGVPPKVTVDKDGDTCAAGAGSVQSPGYHGFLRDGVLTDGC